MKTTQTPPPAPLRLTPSWDLLKPNLQLLRAHYVPLIYLLILPTLVYALATLLLGQPFTTNPGSNELSVHWTTRQTISVSLIAVAGIWALVNMGPLTKYYLTVQQGTVQPLRWYYRHGLRYSLPLFGYGLITGLLIFGGLLLLFVPGFKALRRYILGPYYLVDKQLGVFAAMKLSAQQSKPKPVRGAIWGMLGVQVVASIAASTAGIVPLVGIILTQLISYSVVFLPVLRYREIQALQTA